MSIDTPSTGDVREVHNAWIPLADGCRLAARFWLPPVGSVCGSAPAILEYLPYRKDDVTANQDATRHPYFAAHGFAAVRVDMRGTGDSDGVLLGEYLKQEQDDALEVIEWIAQQPWCSGSVGMIGYSWGGFNGLQVAARRPPQLKAVVSVYSTDDRYTDDCHYMGGCLLGSDMLKWATTMRAYNALPPDPRFRDDWRDVWLKRLAETPAFIDDWLAHQHHDAFWRQGSVAEDFSAIQVPTLVVGGWADPYTNAALRLLENLTCVRKGIIGPWAHVMPYLPAVPGPPIGFLHECTRWFGRWLAGEDTGVEADPLLRVWLQDGASRVSGAENHSGEWVAHESCPPASVRAQPWRLSAGHALVRATVSALDPPTAHEEVAVRTSQLLGSTAGTWCPAGHAEDLPGDQSPDDELSVVFDSTPLDEPLVLLGRPVLRVTLATDLPDALLAVRLCEVAPDGSSELVSWGMLNIAHRDGSDAPRPAMPCVAYPVTVELNALGHRFATGSRIRVALSSTLWPHAWPSPQAATLTVQLREGAVLEMPEYSPGTPLTEPFGPPERTPVPNASASSSRTRRVGRTDSGAQEILDRAEATTLLPAAGTTFSRVSQDAYRIAEDDPLSAATLATREWSLEREGWRVRISATAEMTCDAAGFFVDDTLRAWDADQLVFETHQRFPFPRRGL